MYIYLIIRAVCAFRTECTLQYCIVYFTFAHHYSQYIPCKRSSNLHCVYNSTQSTVCTVKKTWTVDCGSHITFRQSMLQTSDYVCLLRRDPYHIKTGTVYISNQLIKVLCHYCRSTITFKLSTIQTIVNCPNHSQLNQLVSSSSNN